LPVLVDTSRGGRGAKKLEPLLRRRASAFMKKLKLTGCELSVALVGDEEIHALNKRWRRKDKPTDVLSFPAGDWPGPGPKPLGDVVISLDTTRRAAREYGHTLEHELSRYLAHGLLHLLGHDHLKTADAAKMARAELKLLGERGMLGG
jgi:probable rRNA maturation factor